MKKILFLHSSSELYGSDKSLLYLLTNLDKKKYKIFVVLPEEGPLSKRLTNIEGVEVFVHNIAVLRRKYFSPSGIVKYSINLIRDCKFLVKLINIEDISIIYTNTSVVLAGGIAGKLTRKKNVWHVREIIKSNFERKFISFIINRLADVIIANSISTLKSIKRNQCNSHVVYNGVQNFADGGSYHHDGLVIGMMGRINRWKGQKLFVDMAKIILEKNSEVRFLIAGSAYKGEEFLEDDLREYVSDLGLQNSIELLGQIEDVQKFYGSIDIYVHPSTQPEPFGLVVIEAMDMSLPVVATNHGGPTEIIENDKTGYLVDYNTPNQMAETCISLLENPKLRNSIGSAAREAKRRKFSLEKTVSDIEKILDSIN